MTRAKPRWAFELFCSGAGDRRCADDLDLPLGRVARVWWRVRGEAKMFLFQWWWWEPE